MRFRLTCVVAFVAVLSIASLASADTLVQTALYPAGTSSICPPTNGPYDGSGTPGETANQGQHFSDPCSPYTVLQADSGVLQPQPPAILTFAQWDPAAHPGQVLLGVSIFINTFIKTQQTITNSATGANTGNQTAKNTNVLGFGATGTTVTSQIYNSTEFAQNYDFTSLMTNGGEQFIVKQWQNMVTFGPNGLIDANEAANNGFNGEFGVGGGVHVQNTTETVDIVPITINGHPDAVTYNNSGSVTNNIAASALATNGYCVNCSVAPGAGYVGNGTFNIYYQTSGSIVNDLGQNVQSSGNVAGSGVEVEIVYTYGVSTVPEPGTLLLLGSGLTFAGRLIRRRKAARS